MAVIFDIRRGNLQLQLMYKALFELAADRAEFVSMLFAKPRPSGLGPKSTVVDIFSAFGRSTRSEALYTQTLAAIKNHLTKTHGLPLSAEDLGGIEYVYHAFYLERLRRSPVTRLRGAHDSQPTQPARTRATSPARRGSPS